MSPLAPALRPTPLSDQTRSVILPHRRHSGRLTGGHYVTIFALTRGTTIHALLAQGGAHVTGGYGTWEQIAIPRGTPLTNYTGRALYAMDLELLLDGWGRRRSVEAACIHIEQLAVKPDVRPRGKQLVTPPPIRLIGAAPHPELTWVVNGLDWGDALRSFHTGQRLRQAVTLHLLEYVEDAAYIASVRGPAKPNAPRKYQVKRGDNLKTIAAKLLGKSARWQEIAKLNKGLRGWRLAASWTGKTILVPAH